MVKRIFNLVHLQAVGMQKLSNFPKLSSASASASHLVKLSLPYILLPPANKVWCKVIFLHLFVILFTGGWVPCLVGGMPGPGGACSGGCAWSRGCLFPGGAWSRGCLLSGVVPAPRGDAWSREGCLVETPPPGQLLLQAVCILLECILVHLFI